MPPRTLVIACGALAREITTLVRQHGWNAIEVQCLPAIWHNSPERIPGGVRAKIRAARANGEIGRIFVAYGDCGTGGALDAVLKDEGAERIPGAHCYEFFAGGKAFAALHEAEPGTLYLTDYLARNFDRLFIQGLGIDRHPELEPMYFGNYRRLVHLAQTRDEALAGAGRAAAERLGLEFEHRFTGYGGLESILERAAAGTRSSPEGSPGSVARAPGRRIDGLHRPQDGNGATDAASKPLAKQLKGLRPVRASGSTSAAASLRDRQAGVETAPGTRAHALAGAATEIGAPAP